MSGYYHKMILFFSIAIGVCVGVEFGICLGTAAGMYIYVMSPIYPGIR